ncbi:MAG: hypothetical protein KOO62_11090 [candidate division Zixibacteria bacterium]|nr:hypothetical protein [candidate division Zixibacteria bacterium]
MMIQNICIVPLILALLFAGGCGPKRITEETTSGCVPNDVRVDVNDGTMIVSFKEDCSAMKSGYNIYISEQPLVADYSGPSLPATVKPHNHPVFPGDTNPEDGIEQYEAEGLQNGVVYYVSVRTVLADRSLSKPSLELVTACGPRGEMELAIRYSSERDGFSFIRNEFVRADDLSNDLYFYSRDGQDYLASPLRLDGFLRDNKLRLVHNGGELADISDLIAEGVVSSENRVMVKTGDWVRVQTVEGFTALVKVLAVEGGDSERRIRLYYAFSPRTERPLF